MWGPLLVADFDGTILGEILNPRGRTFSYRVNRVRTAKVGIDLREPLADRVLTGDVILKAYEDDELAFLGEPTDSDEVITEATKAVTATFQDPTFGLATRLVGKGSLQNIGGVDTWVWGYTRDTPVDRGTVISELLTAANAESDTHVRMGALEASSTDTVGPWHFKPLSEVLSELSAPLDGYDWQMRPTEPTPDGLGVKWAELDIVAVLGGALRRDAVFAYSDEVEDRGNVKGYTRNVTKQNLTNDGFSLPPGFPDTGTGGVVEYDDGLSQSRWGLRESVVASDLIDEGLRTQLLKETIAVRANPRQAIKIDGFFPEDIDDAAEAGTPIPARPEFGVDYNLGDVVPFRATIDGQTRVNGLFRVYGVDISVDDEGVATPSLYLTPEE
jgi:hypothetical protein